MLLHAVKRYSLTGSEVVSLMWAIWKEDHQPAAVIITILWLAPIAICLYILLSYEAQFVNGVACFSDRNDIIIFQATYSVPHLWHCCCLPPTHSHHHHSLPGASSRAGQEDCRLWQVDQRSK